MSLSLWLGTVIDASDIDWTNSQIYDTKKANWVPGNNVTMIYKQRVTSAMINYWLTHNNPRGLKVSIARRQRVKIDGHIVDRLPIFGHLNGDTAGILDDKTLIWCKDRIYSGSKANAVNIRQNSDKKRANQRYQTVPRVDVTVDELFNRHGQCHSAEHKNILLLARSCKYIRWMSDMHCDNVLSIKLGVDAENQLVALDARITHDACPQTVQECLALDGRDHRWNDKARMTRIEQYIKDIKEKERLERYGSRYNTIPNRRYESASNRSNIALNQTQNRNNNALNAQPNQSNAVTMNDDAHRNQSIRNNRAASVDNLNNTQRTTTISARGDDMRKNHHDVLPFDASQRLNDETRGILYYGDKSRENLARYGCSPWNEDTNDWKRFDPWYTHTSNVRRSGRDVLHICNTLSAHFRGFRLGKGKPGIKAVYQIIKAIRSKGNIELTCMSDLKSCGLNFCWHFISQTIGANLWPDSFQTIDDNFLDINMAAMDKREADADDNSEKQTTVIDADESQNDINMEDNNTNINDNTKQISPRNTDIHVVQQANTEKHVVQQANNNQITPMESMISSGAETQSTKLHAPTAGDTTDLHLTMSPFSDTTGSNKMTDTDEHAMKMNVDGQTELNDIDDASDDASDDTNRTGGSLLSDASGRIEEPHTVSKPMTAAMTVSDQQKMIQPKQAENTESSNIKIGVISGDDEDLMSDVD
eukprot:907185_1